MPSMVWHNFHLNDVDVVVITDFFYEGFQSYINAIDQDDETELLIRVLSFGPVLEVVAPITFRQLMRNRIQKQTLYAARGFSQ